MIYGVYLLRKILKLEFYTSSYKVCCVMMYAHLSILMILKICAILLISSWYWLELLPPPRTLEVVSRLRISEAK